jgi:hypothetical protein
VRNARDLPREVLALQATSPSTFAVTALGGHAFAWVKPAGPAGPDQLIVADALTLQSWMKDEWKQGSITGWPDTIGECLLFKLAQTFNCSCSIIVYILSCKVCQDQLCYCLPLVLLVALHQQLSCCAQRSWQQAAAAPHSTCTQPSLLP